MHHTLERMFHRESTAWAVLGISIAMTILAWIVSSHYLEQDAHQRFEKVVQEADLSIQNRMLGYQSVLRAGAGLFNSSDRVTREEWHIFVDNLKLNQLYPGIQGVGYAVMVSARGKVDLENEVRQDGIPDFAIYPPGARDIYSAIVYLEPVDQRNRRAFGYDMFSEAVRREAMQRACDTGEIALSGHVVLVQESGEDRQQGFLMYMPIYRKGMPMSDVAQRRAALDGFVYGVFRAGDLMHAVIGDGLRHTSFSLYDGDAPNEAGLIYRAGASDEASGATGTTGRTTSKGNLLSQARFNEDVHFVIGGHAWMARFSSSRTFEQEVYSIQPGLIAMGGILADILLFIALFSISHSHRRLRQSHTALTASREALVKERGRYERLVENLPGVVYRCGVEAPWPVSFVSRGVVDLCGITASEFMAGKYSFGDFIHSEDQNTISEAIQAAAVEGRAYEVEFRFGHADREWLWLVARGQVQNNRSGEPKWLDGVAFDITEQKQQQQAIVERELRYRAVVEAASDGFWLVDRQGRLLSVNAAYCRMSGYSQDELLGLSVEALEAEDGLEARLARVDAQGHDRFEVYHRRRDGSVWPAEVTISLMPTPDQVFYFIRDLTEIKAFETERAKAEEKMRSLAFQDPLTKLPNRRLLYDRLKQALAGSLRNAQHGALLFLDMDNFKHLNDSLGHEMGDLLLIEVARRLKACIRETDTVARLGGDEFVIMLPELSSQADESALMARMVGEKVLTSLNQPYRLDEHVHHSTPSVGITLFCGQDGDADSVLKRADMAMYQAKSSGRNMLKFFDAGMEQLVNERELLGACLRKVTPGNELVLHYQPVREYSGSMVGVEALVRWQHPERGLLLPAQFFGLAVESGLGILLGRRVLEMACHQLAEWGRTGRLAGIDLTINIGPRYIRHPGLFDDVSQALAASGADPRRLIFELSEVLLLQDDTLSLEMIGRLQAMGIRFSLDNFGACYLNLGKLLNRLSVDQLKMAIDPATDSRSDAAHAALLDALVVLGGSMETVIVAKGIENEAQLAMLRDQGWQQVQGYLFGKPVPVEELEELYGALD